MRDELRRTADARGDDRPSARHRLEQRLAERFDEARLADNVALGDQIRDPIVVDAAEQSHPCPALEPAAERPVARERERARAEPAERAREPDDVLALDQAADAKEGGALARGIAFRPELEALEIDATVDHLDLPARVGDLRFQLASEVVGDGDDGDRTADDPAGGGCDTGNRTDVRHVLPVRRHDERSVRHDGGDQPGRSQEMRVDDVGVEAARAAAGGRSKLCVTPRTAGSPVDHCALDLVSAGGELTLDLRDEGAEVGIGRARIHLRDEEDPHEKGRDAGYVRCESYVP